MADRDRRSKALFAAHIARMQTSTPAPPASSSSDTAPSASTQPATETSCAQWQASNTSTRASPANSSSGTSRPPRASKVVGSNPMLGHLGSGSQAPSGGGIFGPRPPPPPPLGTLFGSRSPTTSQDPDDDGLFGAPHPGPAGALFGNDNPPVMVPQTSGGSGLFGGGPIRDDLGGQPTSNSTRPSGGLFGPVASSESAAPTGQLFRHLKSSASQSSTNGGLFGPANSSAPQSSITGGLFDKLTSQPASGATASQFVYQPLSPAAATGIFGGPITQITQPYSAPRADPTNAGPSTSHSSVAGQSTLQSSQPPVFGAIGNAKPVPRSPPGNFGTVAAPRIFITDNTMPSTKDYGTPSPSTLFFTLSQLPRYIGPDCHWDFQSMTAVTRYAPWSAEELRLADYTKGIAGPPKNLGEHLNLQSVSTDPTNPGPPVPPTAPKRARYSYGQVSLSSTDDKPATTDSMQTDPKESLAPRSVAIKVGPTLKSEFIVHERILQGSKFFRLALKREWREGQERTVELIEDDPDIFAIYAHYLYSGFITSINKAAAKSIGTDEDCEFQDLVSAYSLGEKLQDDEFQDAVIDAFIEKVVQEDRIDLQLSCQVYEKTLPGSGLRRLLLDIYLGQANPDWLSEDTVGEELHPEFLRDLSMEMLWDRRQVARGHAAPTDEPVLKGGRAYYKRRAGEDRDVRRKRRTLME